MFRLLQANRKATVFEIITFYNGNITEEHPRTHKTLKEIGDSSRKLHRVPLLPDKNMKLKLQFTKDKKMDNRRLEKKLLALMSRFLMRHSDGWVRIGRRQHGNMDTSCLEFIIQAEGGGCAIVWRIFSLYILRR